MLSKQLSYWRAENPICAGSTSASEHTEGAFQLQRLPPCFDPPPSPPSLSKHSSRGAGSIYLFILKAVNTSD